MSLTPLLTPEQVAAILQLGEDPESGLSKIYSLTRARSKRRLPAVRCGKLLRFTESAVQAWIEANQK